MALTAETIDRLKATLLTSGLSQKDQPLFQVINLLIDAVRQSLSQVQTLTGGGGGGGGGILAQSFTTVNNDQGTLPNSRQLWPGQGIQFNNQGQKLVIGAVLPFIMDGRDGEDGMWGPPGIQGVRGPAGPTGPMGLDCYCECCGEVVPQLPIGILTASMDAIVTGAWIFERSPNSTLFVRGPAASISVISTSAIQGSSIVLQTQNGTSSILDKFNNLTQLTLGSDSDALEIVSGGGGALVGAQGVRFPATQVPSSGANTLDDYEEGSWTPVIGGTGGQSGQTYGAQTGRYTKIGKLVAVQFEVALSNKGTITGNVQISGLPFTAESTPSRPVYPLQWSNLATNWVFIVGLVLESTTTLLVRGAQAAAASSDTSLVTADIANNTFFRGAAVYMASA